MKLRWWWTTLGLAAGVCLLAFGFGPTSWAVTDSSPQATLLASWSFEGSLDDGSGDAYHLNQVGSNLYYSAGCLGQALHFDRDAGSYLSRDTDDLAFDFGTGDYSVELWVSFDRVPSRFGEQTLIEKCGGAGCSTSGWGLTVMGDNTVRFIQNDDTHQVLDSPPLDFRVGRWYHLVAVREGTTSYLYLDGAEVASGPAFDLTDTGNSLILGRRFDEGQQFPFVGFLDEVTVYGGALSAAEVLARYQAGAACQALPVPLRIFVYDDYEESGYEGSLREYLEARGHTVTYTHDDVGDIDVWQAYAAYDAILAIHTCGGGTLTNLSSWFQNGRGYVAMLGGGMWDDEDDGYIRDLLGVNESGEVGSGWAPDQLSWADPVHPIVDTPHDGWDLTGIPYGQNQFYVDILDGYTVVSGPEGAVLQTREGVEGAARLAVFGSNYHDEDRSDPEARYLAENLVTWVSNPQPAAWFDPDSGFQRAFPGTVVSHTLSLVNRTGQEATFGLSASGNAWPTSLETTVGPLADGSRADVVVAVEIPSGATTDDQDTVVIEAQAQHDPALVATATLHTSAPGPAYQIELAAEAYHVAVSGSTVLTATVTDRDGLPVVDGTPVGFAVVAGGTLSAASATTTNGQATTSFTGVTDCGLAEIEATSSEGWAPAYVSVGGSGPTDVPGGEIALDTTWAVCDGPFLVHGDVTVSAGVTLTVAAGSQVRFDEGTGLVILGGLEAIGQSDARVLFTANSSPAYPGFWKGLTLGDTLHAASGLLDYAAVSYAGQWYTWGDAGPVVVEDQARPRVQLQREAMQPEQGGGEYAAGILIYRGAPSIQNSLIWRNQAQGLWAGPDSLPIIADNRIVKNEGGMAIESANVAAIETPIPSGEDADVEWRYLAFEEPGPGWHDDLGFDDSGWSTGLTPIADGWNWKTYLDLEGATMYARKIVTPADPLATTYYLRASRDDEVFVWLNGTLVVSDTQGGGAQWTSYVPVTLDTGPNLVAVEMRDSGMGANYFDLELIGGSFQQATVTGNRVQGNGSNGWSGISIAGSSPLVEGNEVANNQANGLWVAGYGWPLIRNNRIHHNGDAGLRLDSNYPGGWPAIYNNVLDSNGSYGLAWDNSWTAQPDIQNNIVTRNVRGISCQESRYWQVRYNDVWANGGDYWGCPEEVSWNNQSIDPFYLDPDGADYHLQLGSPVFDAGNPDAAFNDVDGSRNDMGAYGGPAGETYTYVDVRGPYVKWAMAEPVIMASGETVTLTVGILDPSGVAWAHAEIESPDETVIATLDLYDDGAHGDNLPGDDIYGATWITPPGDHEYLVDILSEDGLGQPSADDNVTGFGTHESLTLTVTNTDDSGPGSLRQALLDAQYGDTVDFDPVVFPPGSPATIFVTSGQLPDLDDGHVRVDASNAGVILDGSGLPGDGEDGLGVTADGNTILGLEITGFPGDGLELQSRGNVVGGTTEAERNILAGNGQNGLRLNGSGARDNVVQGNYIGVDASGLEARPNGESGVAIQDSAMYNLVGGENAEEGSLTAGNLIFANGQSGVSLWGGGTADNTIRGNWIGLNASGTARQAFPADLAVSPVYASDCTLYVATLSTGVHMSTDCGATWSGVNNGLTESRLMQVEIPPDAAHAGTAYALAENGYLFVTVDGGASWSLVSTALEGIDRRNLVLSAGFGSDQTMYASAENWSWRELGDGPGVFKSTNGGVTWTRQVNSMSDERVRKVVASPDLAAKDTLFTLNEETLQRSTDGGRSWSMLPAPDNNLSDLALSPDYATDGTVFVASNNGRIYRSTDWGMNWTGVDALRGDVRFLAVSPAYATDRRVCHGGGWNDQIYCSTDGGETWNATSTGLPGPLNDAGTGIAFSPAYPGDPTMFVLSFAGLSQSTDGGANWQLARGLRDLGNTQGVSIDRGASYNVVGPDNVISNNDLGVTFNDDSTAYNVVAGNLIGTGVDGTSLLGSPEHAVAIWGGHHNLIGGDTPEARNIINGSLSAGAVWLHNPGVTANTVSGNYIGLDTSGTAIVGNGDAGVALRNGANGNVIGGGEPGERNVISGNGMQGVGLWDANTNGNLIQGNYVGTDASGTVALGNGNDGVHLHGPHDNQILDNLVSGNQGNGVGLCCGSETSYNVIQGNRIGTDVSGSYALPNRAAGITLSGGASHNLVGGPGEGQGNLVSGNEDQGIGLWDPDTGYNIIQGNTIGADASGTTTLPNRYDGVHLNGPHDNTIGGTGPGEGNLISGNGGNGMALWSASTTFNIIEGNLIGTDATASQPLAGSLAQAGGLTEVAAEQTLTRRASLASVCAPQQTERADDSGLFSLGVSPALEPDCRTANETASQPAASEVELQVASNGGYGIYLGDGASQNTVGTNNTIAFNAWDGVRIEGSDTLNNTITASSLFHNGGLGIRLAWGGNGELAAPRVQSVNLGAGTVAGMTCPGCKVEVFSADDEEGRIFEGYTTADGSGNFSFAKGSALAGPHVTATATDAGGNTSPFSVLFNLLVYNLGVGQTFEALDNLGLSYDVVDAAGFATVDLGAYDVLFVGFTGNDPQPDDLLQPLLDRRDDLAAFVAAGGGLVANSEDGVVATPLDWQWVPVDVTHRNAYADQIEIAQPAHLLVQGLTEALLAWWYPMHNVFAAWDWPEAEVVLAHPGTGEPVILAGSYGSGRMVLSGSDPDYHSGEPAADLLLHNELYWAAGVVADTPPQVVEAVPQPGSETAARAIIEASFDQLVDPSTVDASSVQVVGSLSGPVLGSVTYYSRTAGLVFEPASDLLVGEVVTVTLSASIEDMSGIGLDSDGDGVAEGSPEDDSVWTFLVRVGETLVVTDPTDPQPEDAAGLASGLTLRQALEQAQAGDTITFDPTVFPPGSPVTIPLSGEPLPELWQGYLTLDASAAGVILDGSGLNWGPGLRITSDGNVVRGLHILRAPEDGLQLDQGASRNLIGGTPPSPGGPCGGDCNLFSGNGNNGIWVGGSAARHNIIKGNYVGTNADGTGAMGNAFNGVTIWEAPYTQVESNLISANCTSGDWCDGLGMYGAGVVSSVVVGNQIGVDASGLNPLGNHGSGITVAYGASDNRIGGSSAAERNIVSANQNGIELVHDYTMGNALLGNYVGTDASGLVALGNQWEGISLEDSANTRVGGAAPGEGNVIAGNGGEGLRGQPSSAQIVGNYVGTDATGLGALGNGGGGIALYGTGGTSIEGNLVANNNYGIRVDGSNNVIRNNQIGVNAAGDPSGHPGWGLAIVGYQNASGQMDSFDNWVEGNVIAHSGQGVLVYEWGGARVNGNTLTQNSIYGSSGLSWLYNLDDGISLYGNANHNLAPPVVGAFNVTAGTASGTACADCTVEVFSDDDDEGRWYEGTVGADGAGTWFLIKGSPFSGANVHATATDANGNTSEFSGPPPIVSSVSPTSTVAGTANLGVILSGDFFRDNELLAVGFGDGINVTSVEFRDHKQIKVYLDVDGGAALGPRDVTVTNYEGQSGTLPAGFEVVPVPPPPPTVTGVVADQIAPGASGNLRIYGTGFIDRPAVAFGGGGVTVEEVTFDDPTRLTVHVSVDPAASLGLRDVTVTNPDGQADTLLAGLSVVPPRFEEVGGAAGVDDVGDGLGVAWGDYDGDGDQDLFVAQGGMAGGEADILYQNQGDGTFADVSGAAGLGDEGPARAAVWGDYDNDGDLDLYVTRYGQANLLYANNGDGTFAEGAASAGVDRTGDSSGAAWADYDLDGQLDLFVVGESSPNVLYRNNGDCTFDDVTGAAGVAGEGSGQEGAAWGDYDDDGDPDLYVASNAAPNQLYRNNGDGTFTEVGSPAGVDDARASRGVAWGDLDNDSDLDLYVTNYGDVDAIYRNNGNGTFTDVAAQAGTDEPANGTGVSLGDFDNDGDLDIWVINAGGPKTLYLNRGDGTFMPDLEPALEHGGNAHGGAAADYDNDGDLDLYLTNRDDGNPNLLYRNGTDVTAVHAPAAAPHWLHVRLVGTLSNARGIGARVRVVAGGLSQIRGVSGGSGFWSQDSLPAEFGLGSHVGPVTVEVTWPSGVVDSLPGVTADQVLTVVESTPYLHNMAVVSVAPDGEQPAGVPFHPVVTLRNLGQLAETGVPVTCRIEYDGGQVYLQPMASGLVVPGAWATLVFPAFAPTDTGEHLMTCWVRLPGDENPADDELSRELLVTQQIADAWTKDNPTDDGDVPSGLNNWYGSPDLWVRHAPDGGLIHQDPVAGVENTVYVRIRNRGNTPVYEGTVSVYWIEPSLGVRCGDWASIADIFFTDLLPGEVRIVSTPWVPTRTGHTCLQDVIDSAQDPYDRGLECAPQWVPWDNNVEWRNVNVYSNPGGVRAGLLDVKDAEVQLVNVYDRPEDVDMIVERLTFPLSGDILVQLPSALFDRWLAYGKHWGEGIEVLPATNEIRVTGEISATIGAIPMQASEEVTVGLHFEGPAGLAFELATRERIGGITTGGVGYQWIIPDTTPPEVIDTVPAAGAVGVALDAPLAITFSEPIGPLTLELVLAPDPGGWSLIWNEAGTVVTATHTAFEMGTTYQATATAGDAAGNQMVSAKSWTFTAVSEENRVYLPLILRH